MKALIKKWVVFCCTLGVVWITVMDILNLNDCIRKKILTEQILLIFYDIIVIKENNAI